MNGNKQKIAVLDSNVVIDLAKERVSSAFVKHYNILAISIISYIEVLGYNFANDPTQKQAIMEWLDTIPAENLNMPIAMQTIVCRQTHKIKLPDALILATARYLNADLITSNLADFKNIDENVVVLAPLSF